MQQMNGHFGGEGVNEGKKMQIRKRKVSEAVTCWYIKIDRYRKRKMQDGAGVRG